MKVRFERIVPDDNSSFRTLHIHDVPISKLNWQYHYHPEVELVCVLYGTGTRHIGYHKSNYKDGDLVLIGSNVPHSGFGLNATEPHEEIVIQFKEEILKFPKEEPESIALLKLIELSKYGVLYSRKIKNELIPKIKKLLEYEGYRKYLQLMEILHDLSKIEDYKLLNTEIMPYSIITKNKARIQKIFTYVEKNYDKDIQIENVAEITNLTLPAFCNFFKKATQLTFTEFVNRYRIDKACLMIIQDKTISDCCFGCGFNNVTYFNRTFKKYTGKTPSEFKKEYSEAKQFQV